MEVKLVHKSGFLTCNHRHSSDNSRWGCGYLTSDSLTVITDANKKGMFPNWGVFPAGFTTKTSNYVTYTPLRPIFTENGLDLQIWFNEDLYDSNEYDNAGIHCVSVFAKLRKVLK